jgi:hypothetical protein
MNLHAWVLLGDMSSRKGSTIRALTGISRDRLDPIEVTLTNGQSIQIHPKVASINEKNVPTPESWLARWSRSAVRQNLILAFRLRFGPKGRRPEDYVKALVEAGGAIESIVTLGETTPDWAIQIGAPYAHILDTATTPTNAIAHRVRQFWGWL